MSMKTLVATALVALGLLSTVPAQADEYPRWAERAFQNLTQ
jgi:hypothetical protein